MTSTNFEGIKEKKEKKNVSYITPLLPCATQTGRGQHVTANDMVEEKFLPPRDTMCSSHMLHISHMH
jgi:hypothetical protein